MVEEDLVAVRIRDVRPGPAGVLQQRARGGDVRPLLPEVLAPDFGISALPVAAERPHHDLGYVLGPDVLEVAVAVADPYLSGDAERSRDVLGTPGAAVARASDGHLVPVGGVAQILQGEGVAGSGGDVATELLARSVGDGPVEGDVADAPFQHLRSDHHQTWRSSRCPRAPAPVPGRRRAFRRPSGRSRPETRHASARVRSRRRRAKPPAAHRGRPSPAPARGPRPAHAVPGVHGACQIEHLAASVLLEVGPQQVFEPPSGSVRRRRSRRQRKSACSLACAAWTRAGFSLAAFTSHAATSSGSGAMVSRSRSRTVCWITARTAGAFQAAATGLSGRCSLSQASTSSSDTSDSASFAGRSRRGSAA
ncbi:hypothetical protein SALBM311S_08689 [Streptomyces alboniger]